MFVFLIQVCFTWLCCFKALCSHSSIYRVVTAQHVQPECSVLCDYLFSFSCEPVRMKTSDGVWTLDCSPEDFKLVIQLTTFRVESVTRGALVLKPHFTPKMIWPFMVQLVFNYWGSSSPWSTLNVLWELQFTCSLKTTFIPSFRRVRWLSLPWRCCSVHANVLKCRQNMWCEELNVS